jgi:hypothetical protein
MTIDQRPDGQRPDEQRPDQRPGAQRPDEQRPDQRPDGPRPDEQRPEPRPGALRPEMRIEQEPDEIPRGLVARSTVLIALGIAVSVGATLLLAGPDLGAPVRIESRPPARLDVLPFYLPTPAERAQAAAAARLRSYGWADRARGTIHVPLDVAIELYLAEPRP